MFCLIAFFAPNAQEQGRVVLTLDDCINTALDRNISIKTARNNELIARSNQFQALLDHLPNLNGSIDYDYFFGTTFDQNAAKQVSATTNTSGPRLSSNLIFFNGFRKHSTRKQRTYEYLAAKENVEDVKLTTEAGILGSFLMVILGEENIRISVERVEFLEAQLDRAVKRESVGVGNMEEVFNFRSQLATERLNLQTLKNIYESNKLTLLQAMRLDPTQADYALEPLTITEEELLTEIEPFDEILESTLNVNPGLKGAKASKDAAKYQYRAAWGSRFPTVSVFGLIGSNYSSNGAVNPNETVIVNGEPVPKFEPNATYFTQLRYNQFEYLNFTMNIPIFNQWQANNQVQIAKLNMANSELALEQANQNITNAVQQVYLDLVAAQTTYISARENLDALQQSFDFMTKRYETGNTDFYTYLESLNNKNRAEIQLINAKYSIVLRKRILDTYRRI